MKFLVMLSIMLAALLAVSACVSNQGAVQTPVTPTTLPQAKELTIVDGYGRNVTVSLPVKSVICSGAGCLRYLIYVGGLDLVVGVDDIEKKGRTMEGRPYYLLYGKQLKDLPLIGEFRGKDDPEKIIAIDPEVIFKTGATGQPSATSGADADKLQDRTGIPVVSFPYGSLRTESEKAEMYGALRMMGKVIGKEKRAEELIAYIEATMKDLEERTKDIPPAEQKRVYVGGVSMSGAHGIISTEPAYPPFLWVHANNVASGMGTAHVDVAKEAIVGWDPEYVFIDVSTLQMDNQGAIGQLKTDPALRELTAVKEGRVYGVLPYNFYNTNYETVLADAYFVGKILYPDRFADVDPEKKADEIFTFFLGKPCFSELNKEHMNLGFTKLQV